MMSEFDAQGFLITLKNAYLLSQKCPDYTRVSKEEDVLDRQGRCGLDNELMDKSVGCYNWKDISWKECPKRKGKI